MFESEPGRQLDITVLQVTIKCNNQHPRCLPASDFACTAEWKVLFVLTAACRCFLCWFHGLVISQTFLIFIFYFYSCLIGTIPTLVFICGVCLYRRLLGLQRQGFAGWRGQVECLCSWSPGNPPKHCWRPLESSARIRNGALPGSICIVAQAQMFAQFFF